MSSEAGFSLGYLIGTALVVLIVGYGVYKLIRLMLRRNKGQ